MKKNYRTELIPDVNSLISYLLESYEKERKNAKYSFKDIFEKKNEKYTIKNDFKNNFNLNSKTSHRCINNNELSGLYIFFDKKDIPLYVGISRTIFRRLRQHFLSVDHNQSSLAYLIAKKQYSEENGKIFSEYRDRFPFNQYNESIQLKMREEWKTQFIPEDNSYKIYLKEIYIACYEKTYWNTFITH
jgi:hypothetical protein